MPDYNIRLTVKTSIEKYVTADSLEEAEDLLWKDLIDMDPQHGHYILINGSKTYDFLNKEEVNGGEDGKRTMPGKTRKSKGKKVSHRPVRAQNVYFDEDTRTWYKRPELKQGEA